MLGPPQPLKSGARTWTQAGGPRPGVSTELPISRRGFLSHLKRVFTWLGLSCRICKMGRRTISDRIVLMIDDYFLASL